MRFWKRSETALEREIAHHIHQLAAEYQRQGHLHDVALQLARREFGGAEQIKERCREERRFAWLTGVRQDVIFGLRMMRRAPIVTAAAVLSLALGIGANGAIASLMDVILWRSLPVPQPQQLRLVHWQAHGFPREVADGASGSMYNDGGVDVADFFAYPTFELLRRNIADQASLSAYNDPVGVSVSYNGHAAVSEERAVSGNFFSTLRVRAMLGRMLVDDDDRAAAPATVVVSHRFWASVLGFDRNALGKTLTINRRPHEIVGVLDPSFFGLHPGDSAALYAPIHHSAQRDDLSHNEWLTDQRLWGTQVIARLAPGTDPAQLEARMDRVFRGSWTRQPARPESAPRIRLDEGARGLGNLSREFRNSLLVLAGLVGLLLVIACSNIANLLLARALARRKEIAMRISLGCNRARLIRQLLTESALIALFGGAASLVVAYATGNLLGQFLGGRDNLPLQVSLDPRLLLLIAGITTISLAIFAVFPAWQGSRAVDSSWLKPGTGFAGTGKRRIWTGGRALVVSQVAMSVVLVMAAVTFVQNLRALQSADPGFDRRNLVIFGVRPGSAGYEPSRLPQFYFDLERRLAATRGVSSAGLSWMRPMNVGGWWERVRLSSGGEGHQVFINSVTPNYLPLFTQRLIAGRNLTWGDIGADSFVAVISEDLARRLGGSSVLGRKLALTEGRPGVPLPSYEIVGIAPAFAATSMKERPYAMWVPFRRTNPDATVVVRTAQPPRLALETIRQTMNEIDPNLPLVEPITMEEQIAKVLQRERMFATLCSGFGILALALSVVGLYGMMAYSTSQRRGEMGVRLALGARPRNVLAMVLREGLSLAVAGIVLGLPLVWLGAKFAEKELFRMKVLEPGSLLAVLGILGLAAVIAVGVPAAKAAALQPSEILRQE